MVLINIVTGVFVNDSIDAAQNDHGFRTAMETQHKRELVNGLKLLFKEIDLVHLTSEVRRTREQVSHLERQGAQQIRMIRALMTVEGVEVSSGPLSSVIDGSARPSGSKSNDFLASNANVP